MAGSVGFHSNVLLESLLTESDLKITALTLAMRNGERYVNEEGPQLIKSRSHLTPSTYSSSHLSTKQADRAIGIGRPMADIAVKETAHPVPTACHSA